jgi:hypothetical protein
MSVILIQSSSSSYISKIKVIDWLCLVNFQVDLLPPNALSKLAKSGDGQGLNELTLVLQV